MTNHQFGIRVPAGLPRLSGTLFSWIGSLLLAFRAGLLIVAIALAFGFRTEAYSIEAVVISPTNAIISTDEVVMEVKISTPEVGTGLSQPPVVVIDRDEVVVVLHPASGSLPMIGTLTTNVPLGKLPVGNYRFVVVLVPPFPTAAWGTKFVEGSFSVIPQLEIVSNSGGMFLEWPSSGESYVIEYADTWSPSPEWKDLVYDRESWGERFLVRLEPTESHRLFRLIQR